MKWQYCIVDDEDRLNEMGQHGWELVAVVPHEGRLKFYLKKPEPTLKERVTGDQREEVYRRLNLGDIL